MLIDQHIQVKDVNAHTQELAHFVRCVETGEKPLVTAEQGVEIQQILDAIYESAKSGRSVDIEDFR